MSTTENTNCISDSDDDLYEQVVEILDGEDVAWIRRAHRTGILRGQELLALILYAIRDLDDPTRDPKKIIRHWAPQLMAYVKRYHYAARHPDSLCAGGIGQFLLAMLMSLLIFTGQALIALSLWNIFLTLA